jgi:hypothetical protein
VKTTSGGRVKAFPRRAKRSPQERSLRGDRTSAELNTPSEVADRPPEQGPEGEVTGAGAVAATRRQAKGINDRRARTVDETARLGGGNKPLRGESRTWLWDETSPRGSGGRKPSRACETPGADRRAGVGARSQVDLRC